MLPDQGWHQFDTTVIQSYKVALYSDPVASACVRVLQGNLTAGGLRFSSRDNSMKSSGEFQAHLDLHFVPFVREALTELILYGFCFFHIDEGNRPVALPMDQVDCYWRVNADARSRVEVCVFENGRPDPGVLAVVDSLPGVEGAFRSVMSSYYRDRTIIDTFLRNAILADKANARPDVFTSTLRSAQFNEGDVARYGEVETLRAALRARELNVQEGTHVHLHEQNSILVDSFNRLGEAAVQRLRTDPTTGLRNYDAGQEDVHQRVLPLPLDARVETAPRPVVRGDIVTHLQHFENVTCTAFGVTADSLGMGRKGGHSSAEALHMQTQVTRETTERWKQVLSRALVGIYNLIWLTGGADVDVERARGDTPLTDITVVFPSTVPRVVFDTLFEHNIITYGAYRQYLSDTYQLPLSEFKPDDPRLAAHG